MSNPIDDISNASGQQRLWLCVIQQALQDAVRNADQPLPNDRMDVLRAREWLTQPSTDLDTVCSLAGLEPDCVRAFAKREIDRAIAHPRQRRVNKQRGVGPNSGEGLRDRRGSTTQDLPEIGFSHLKEPAPCP
jgi:hypothetical protein